MAIKNHLIFGTIAFCLLFLGTLEAQNFNLPDAPFLGERGYNQTSGISFDLSGNPVGKGKDYFNSLGKGLQSLSWDVLTGKVWGSQILYDRQGRRALQTLSAPNGIHLSYSNTFILNGSGSSYNTSDFDTSGTVDNPRVVHSNSPLGAYFNSGNTANPYQDVTVYPFVRTVFSRLNPGKVLKVLGGNKIGGEWKQSYSFSMPMGTHVQAECSSYYFPIDGSTTRVTKTVFRDVHGVDTVVFADSDGNTLAAARSGEMSAPHCDATDLLIGPQGYVDIHIPKHVTQFNISGFDPIATGGSLKVFDLISETQVGSIVANGSMDVATGFYRIAVASPTTYAVALEAIDLPIPPVKINHIIDYYDFSFNNYDKVGRLISATQPLAGMLESTFVYNSLGQLMEADSPDEGNAKFLYRKDGQIRFSQNELQASNGGEFSYTNYDDLGRPIESGVVTNRDGPIPPFSGLWVYVDSQTTLDSYYKKEVHRTVYDIPDPELADIFTAIDCQIIGHHYQQTFVAGNVVKTYTEEPYTSTTWYSYDVQGRVTWIVQKIAGMRCPKTIDYSYHPATGQVVRVDFQQKNSDERFIHKYQYNAAGQLITVFTSRTGLDNDWMVQADYTYAESGELVRTVLVKDLQGIDYVYNLNGQLKAINHPSLMPQNDPGGDGTNGIPADVFGMALDYYNGDYTRSGTPTPVANQNTHGTDLFNGNIKGVRFNTQGVGITGGNFQSYMYGYDRNNWLTGATYGMGSISNANGSYGVNFTPDPNGDYGLFKLSYDANGNILRLDRNGYTDANGDNSMDNFGYSYDGNRLRGIEDYGDNSDPNRYDDLRDQSGNGSDNYIYNGLGQLVSDAQGQKVYEYNASGLVTRVRTFGPGGDPQVIFLQDFSLASIAEANQWARSPGGEVKIQYFDYIPDGGTASCTYLDNTYGRSLQLELTKNQSASRLLNVAAGIPHTLDLNVIVDQWGTGQLPAGYKIEVYNAPSGPSLPSLPIASVTYNAALAYIIDPDLSGSACAKYYENSESLTFTPSGGRIKLVLKKLANSGREPIYIDNISLTVGTVPLLDIAYNDRGQRLQKKRYSPGNKYAYYTYYVRDVSGTVMGIYSQVVNESGATVDADPSAEPSYREPALAELPVYGAGRLGVLNVGGGGSGGNTHDSYLYQLTDHLGNVRAVISKAPNGTPMVLARTDYYPFGMPMPNRNVEGNYRYKFQGQEKDPETGKEAFELRLWDARIGRWLTPDPYGIHHSPYLGMANNPIGVVDRDGGIPVPIITGAIGAIINAGINIYSQAAAGELDFSSGKTWARIGVAAGGGFIAGATGNLGAAVAANAVGDVADQLIANGGDFSNVNYTQSAFAGAATFIGGKAGGKIANNWFVKTQARAIHTKLYSRKFYSLGKVMRGTSKSIRDINDIAYKNSSEVFGGLMAGGASQLLAPSNDYIRNIKKPNFDGLGNFNQPFNSFNFFNFGTGGGASEVPVIQLPPVFLTPGNPNNPNIVKDHIQNN